jgi:hypothetical protein
MWPDLARLKQVLGVTSDTQDDLLDAALDAAIEQVQIDVSGSAATFDDTDYPDGPTASLAQAALLLAVMTVKAPDAPYGVAAVFDTGGIRVAAEHPSYLRMLVGQRKTFGLA